MRHAFGQERTMEAGALDMLMDPAWSMFARHDVEHG